MDTFWLGFVSGVPLMIAVGPIAVLLVEYGIGRGLRGGWPAAVGVAGADLTFATIAAVCGATIQAVLHPYATMMRWAAAGLLLALAAVMLRRAVTEIRAYRSGLVELDLHGVVTPVTDVVSPAGLAGRMMALTLMNPLTIVAFTSLVVATGERASNLGWPLGIATASVAVHLGLVSLGATLRRALPPIGPSWFRFAGSLFIAGLATNLVVGR